MRRWQHRLHCGQDRPRSRGVYTDDHSPRSPSTGSSPLARGLRFGICLGRIPPWIIPARAGFTDAERGLSVRRWDHPRSRGVYMAGERVDIDARGSSPLARGLPRLAVLLQRPAGIIPARAGFTAGITGKTWVDGDHPRSRGVYCVTFDFDAVKWGSSPARAGFTFVLLRA